jgi:hypothetical protein
MSQFFSKAEPSSSCGITLPLIYHREIHQSRNEPHEIPQQPPPSRDEKQRFSLRKLHAFSIASLTICDDTIAGVMPIARTSFACSDPDRMTLKTVVALVPNVATAKIAILARWGFGEAAMKIAGVLSWQASHCSRAVFRRRIIDLTLRHKASHYPHSLLRRAGGC